MGAHLDAVRVDLRGWGVVHANGRLKLLFLDRLVAVVELRPSLLVRRLDLHSLPAPRTRPNRQHLCPSARAGAR
eukprot:769543-Rhodomonas_salina.1